MKWSSELPDMSQNHRIFTFGPVFFYVHHFSKKKKQSFGACSHIRGEKSFKVVCTSCTWTVHILTEGENSATSVTGLMNTHHIGWRVQPAGLWTVDRNQKDAGTVKRHLVGLLFKPCCPHPCTLLTLLTSCANALCPLMFVLQYCCCVLVLCLFKTVFIYYSAECSPCSTADSCLCT